MSKAAISRPLADLAEEAAELIENLAEVMLREWTISAWRKGEPLEAVSSLATPDHVALLETTGLRCAAWSEEHKTDAVRTRFLTRYTGFLTLVGRSLEGAKSVSQPLLGPYISREQARGQKPVVLLEEDSARLARLAATHLPETLRAWALDMRHQGAPADPTAGKGDGGGDAKNVRAKRSTQRGEAPEKLKAALRLHHQYEDGGCLNTEPINNNELARLAKVSNGSASAFFKREFGSYLTYRVICRSPSRLVDELKSLSGEEDSPLELGGRRPRRPSPNYRRAGRTPGSGDYDDEDE